MRKKKEIISNNNNNNIKLYIRFLHTRIKKAHFRYDM